MSTWCDILVRELADVEFTVLAITGGSTSPLRWDPPPNVEVVRIPLWDPTEPTETLEPWFSPGAIRERVRATTSASIEEEFIPALQRLLRALHEEVPVPDGGAVHALWRYGRRHHVPTAWRSRLAWHAFTDAETAYAAAEGRFAPTVFDLTTSLRWLYNLMLPLAAPVKRTDIAHVTIAASAVLPAIVASHEYGTPIIVTDHGVSIRERYLAVSTAEMSLYGKSFLLRLGAYLSRLGYGHASIVAPVADYNRRWEQRYGADPSRIQTIYNGVDPSVFVPRQKPPARTRPTVVAAARIMPVKDIETMIRAAAVTRATVPDVEYLVYGSTEVDEEYTERCRALVDELGLDGTFTFAGFHPSPAELYAEGDISVLSSISEGFPYTVLESMACSRPVVATDVGGVREALEGCGIIVPPRDPDALGAAVARLLTDEDLRLSLGRRGRDEVLARFRTQRSVDAYRALYAKAVA